jgi:hypothetical protein
MISLPADPIFRPGAVLKSGCSLTPISSKAIVLPSPDTELDMVARLGMGQAEHGQVISRAPVINNLKIMPTMHHTTKANTLNSKPANQIPF